MVRSALNMFRLAAFVAGMVAVSCTGDPIDATTLLANLESHVGKRVLLKAKFRSGARCRLETPDGEWKTYCGNCQYCRGPLVLDVGHPNEGADVRKAAVDGDPPQVVGNRKTNGDRKTDLNTDGDKADGDETDDWPLILGGVWRGRDIRCTGKLNQVECYPFEPGRTYVVRGRIEDHHPRRLLVSDFWSVTPAPPPAR